MPAGHALTADSEVLTFHKNTYVFDGLSIAYVLVLLSGIAGLIFNSCG
jgi:hypothetical protein